MINLAPHNPNKKLKARRVKTLKNLEVVQTDEQALEVLKTANNNLALAVLMRRKKVTLEQAKALLIQYNGNVVQALRGDQQYLSIKSE